MTKIKNCLKKIFFVFLVTLSIVTVASCTVKKENPDEPKPTISITVSNSEVKFGDSIKLNVKVENSEDTSYTWEISHPEVVSIDNEDVLSVKGEVLEDVKVTVTAVLNADKNVNASKEITVKKNEEGGDEPVGELTSEMLAKISNESITVNGVIVDYYQDFNQSRNNSTNKYFSTVTMSEGAWQGTWYSETDRNNVISDNYRKGEQDGIKDQYGNTGHALNKVYIDLNNKVAVETVKDYISVPAIWEAQHLWNHLGELKLNKFTHDAENDVYQYNIDLENMDDLYLMTYLSYSLTPMLSDTLVSVYLKVENGEIVKLLAQTEILYYGADTQEDADAMSYTTLEVEFSNIGTTVVEDPTPYEAPQHADKLENALEKMYNSKNYTFQATDVTTYAPSTDGGEYEIESVEGPSKAMLRRNDVASYKVYNYTSSVGTVGCFGQITQDAALFANTGKYTYSDGKPYYTEYSGYKQNADNTYEEFEFSSETMSLVGTKKLNGNIFDSLPTFDFSASIFKFAGMSTTANGKSTYTFVLRDSAITRDVAMEISAYHYATDADASTTQTLTIVVDEDGNFVSSVYPYSLVEGTYLGYCSTIYSNVGTTKLDDDLFDGYVPRELKTSWSDYITKYYSPDFSTLTSREESTAVVLEAVYGESAKDLPAPSLFLNILGDNISGPFYHWKEVGVDNDGNPINRGYISITVSTTEYDENYQITNYHELMAELQSALEEEGFVLSVANTDTTGGASGRSDRYVCFIKGDIQIVIQNNHTRFLWVYFYHTGDWTLNR